MTHKSEITRDDLAALTILRKMMDRLDAEQADYDESIKNIKLMVSIQNNPVGSHIPFTIPDWDPSLTRAEYHALKAWHDGKDVMLHVLSEPR